MEYLPEFLDYQKLEQFIKSDEVSKVYRAVKVLVEINFPLNSIITDEYLVNVHLSKLFDTYTEEFMELVYLLKHVKINPVIVDTLMDIIESRINSGDFNKGDLEFLEAILHQIRGTQQMFSDKIDEIFHCLIKHNLFSNHPDWKQLIYHTLLPSFLYPCNEARLMKLLDLNRLDLICALHKYFITKNVHLPGFWSQIQNALRYPMKRKNAVFLLKRRLELSENPENDLLFHPLNSMHFGNLIQLLEASDAKQLHLLQPSMHLLHMLNELHLSWQVTAWVVYMSHPHLAVVEATLCSLLKETWWLEDDHCFNALLPYVLRGFNITDNLELYSFCGPLFKHVTEQQMTTIRQNCDNIPWTPISFYYFHKELLPYMPLNSVSILNLLKRLQAVPDKSVRDTFMELHFKPKIIQYIACDKNFGRAIKEMSYAVFLHYYNGDTIEWLDPQYLEVVSETLQHSYNLQSFYKVNIVTYSYLQFLIAIQIDKINSADFKELSEKYLRQTFSDEIVDEFGVEMFYQAVLAPKPKHVEFSVVLEDILMNSAVNFTKRSAALQIYSSLTYNLPRDEVIIKIWVDMLLHEQYKFDESTCKAFLKLHKLTSDREDICNTILNTQTDSVVVTLFEYLNGDVEVSILKQCCHKLLDMKRSSCFKKACDIFFGKLSSACHIHLLEIKSFHTLFKENLHVRYLITKKWANMELVHDKRILKLAFEDCLISEAVRSKKEKMEFKIMMEILDDQDNNKSYEYLLHQWHCYKSQATVVNAMIICYNFNASDVLRICDIHLEKRFQKRYYADSQIHLEKIRIYQLLLLVYQYDAKIMEEITRFPNIFKYLYDENNQNDVKQFQILLLTDLQFYNKIFYFIDDSMNSSGESNSVTNVIPILYHIVRYHGCEEQCMAAIGALLKYAIGASFKRRVFSQISIHHLLLYAREKNWKSVFKKHKNIEHTLAIVLNNAEIKWNSDLKYLMLFNPIAHYTAESIFFDIPRLNNVCEQEWRLYPQLFKEMLTNKETFCDLNFYNIDRKYSNLSAMVPKIQETFDMKLIPSVPQPNNLVQRKPKIDCTETSEGDRSALVKSELVVIGSLVVSAANLGGLARTCHILGAATLVVHDIHATKTAAFISLSMSAERWLDIQEVKVDKIWTYLERMRNEGYAIIGAEQTSHSVRLSDHSFKYKTVLLLGNERTGIPADLLTMMDTCIEIPQHGVVRSLNVHVAAALIVYEYMQKINCSEIKQR